LANKRERGRGGVIVHDQAISLLFSHGHDNVAARNKGAFPALLIALILIDGDRVTGIQPCQKTGRSDILVR